MNQEHMKQVRDFIAGLPDAACDMGTYYEIAFNEDTDGYFTFTLMQEKGFACGSAACIAGWTSMLSRQATPHEWENEWKLVHDDAQAYLGLTRLEADNLFCSMPSDTPYEGWKEWMLDRLDQAIHDGTVHAYVAEEYDDSYDEPGEEPKEEESNDETAIV